MPWNPNTKTGVDHPIWEWLAQNPIGTSFHGCGNAYDGRRYIYWLTMMGTSGNTPSTTHLLRYDTWSDGWHYIATVTSGAGGMDLEYDPVRNVLYLLHGGSLTSWQVFNLNLVNVTVCNTVCPPWVATTMAPALPAAANLGASFTLPDDLSVATEFDRDVTIAASTTTTIVTSEDTGTFGPGIVGLQVRFTSGNISGQTRIIASVASKSTMTVAAAFGAAPTAGSAFVIELPTAVSSGGNTTTTLSDTGATSQWAANQYANSDVIITAGTGAGQRRRIASNTATVLTLAAAVGTNPRTGPWATVPDTTSRYRIVPSSDFLYYQPGNGSAAFHRIEVAPSGAAPVWGTLAAAPGGLSGGANTFFPDQYAPFQILALRGGGTNQIYSYAIGPNAWATLVHFPVSETWTTGTSSAMLHGKRRLFITKDSNPRAVMLDLATGIHEPFPQLPYANPGGFDGKRSRFVTTPDGVEYLYHWRAGGQEFFRIPLEWRI